MKNILIIVLGISLLCIVRCVPSTSDVSTDISSSIVDPEIQKILDLQDRQLVRDLYSYFRHKNPAYRYKAIMAFASIKDVSTIDSLVKMLKDPIIEVRSAAAFALGQIGSEKAVVRLIASFNGKDTNSVNNVFNKAIIEAVGKAGNINDLKAIATVKTYRNTDTLLLEGQALAIYRMALRNITTTEGTSRMVDLLYLENTPEQVRFIAANYIGFAKEIDLSLSRNRLIEVFTKDRNVNIKLALANGMGKSKDTLYLPILKTKLISENDYRLKCNILRSFEHFPYVQVRDMLLKYVKDPNPHLANVASSVIIKNGSASDVPMYATFDTITTPWQVRANMNAAVLSNTGIYFTNTKNTFSERILSNIKSAKDVYSKTAYINALAQDPYNYYNLSQLFATEKNPIIKTSILEAQGKILRHPLFFKAFGNEYAKPKGAILSNLLTGIKSGDVGQIAVAAVILKDPSLGFKQWIRDTTLFSQSIEKLKKLRDVEAYNELKSCQAYFAGKKDTVEKPIFNHPIQWSKLMTIGDSSIAAVKTTQGIVRIKLDRQSAPGSVANFLDLVDSKYFNNKTWHRVVPNFVVQTGCPRGDGYGSLDYTIRSELNQDVFHQEGLVGMASAGNHTEGTQWFITLSPAPHLDGKYTIFGRVVSGMDVVHKLLPGDKIVDIIIVK